MNWKGLTHSLLRFTAGFLFLWHGAQKLFGFAGAQPVELVSQLGLGGVIEFFGGALICIGLFTRWAAFVASGMMAAAFWQVHAFNSGAWERFGALGLHPLLNGGELAVLNCFVFLFLWANGPGEYSIDARRAKS